MRTQLIQCGPMEATLRMACNTHVQAQQSLFRLATC